jgi:hypothetical protein
MFEIMISLLGRLVYPPETLRLIVMKWKKKPEDYVKAYNLCDGEHTVKQIADAINVTGTNLSPILAEWKELGIVYEVIKKGGKFYKKLYKLEMPKPSEVPKVEKPETTPEEIVQEKPATIESEKKQNAAI